MFDLPEDIAPLLEVEYPGRLYPTPLLPPQGEWDRPVPGGLCEATVRRLRTAIAQLRSENTLSFRALPPANQDTPQPNRQA